MKTIIKKYLSAALLGIALTFSACNSLDLSPIDYYGNANYWKTVPQVQAYVNGMHLDLRNTHFTRDFTLGEARGGLQVIGTSSQGVSTNDDIIKSNTLSGDNPGLSQWGGAGSIYGNIFDCNLMIQNVENSEMHTNNKTQVDFLLAQTYGIRALHYFNLYRAYGGVPLIDKVKVLDGQVTPDQLYTARATPKEVMDFIKADLKKSLDYFTSSGSEWVNNVTWSKAATQMLAAQVYLWSAKVSLGNQTPASGDLAAAEGYLNDVKNNTRFGLLTDFDKIFASNNESNKEVIFAINYADGESTSNVPYFLYADASINLFFDKNGVRLADPLNLKSTGLQRYEYTLDFWKTFSDKDKRRSATFYEYYNNKGEVAGTVMKKFIGSINSTGSRVYDSNEPIFRYSEVLLMLAEVENMKGGDPAKYINQIRQRAYGTDWNVATDAYVNSDFKSNEYAILRERDKEFVAEGKRWYDVIRMKDAVNGQPLAFDVASAYTTTPVLKSTEKYKVLWPVDKNTLNADPSLKQTPGYAVAGQTEEVW
ncbi:MAG: RagB/SusD family nutrient uptake outer membrane protein [Paludibacteraceae bacterium]